MERIETVAAKFAASTIRITAAAAARRSAVARIVGQAATSTATEIPATEWLNVRNAATHSAIAAALSRSHDDRTTGCSNTNGADIASTHASIDSDAVNARTRRVSPRYGRIAMRPMPSIAIPVIISNEIGRASG